MLEPGTRFSHHDATLAARAGKLLVWVGEAGVRLYAAGQTGGARSDLLLYQAKLALDYAARLKVVRKMYEIRFGEKPLERRSAEQLRGIEGGRVKKLYQLLAKEAGVEWKGRNYDQTQWDNGDMTNRCISSWSPLVLTASAKRRGWVYRAPLFISDSNRTGTTSKSS